VFIAADGVYCFNYLQFMCHQVPLLPSVELRIQFAQFDRDGDGIISQQELTEVMMSLGLKINSEAVKKILQRADTDGVSAVFITCVLKSIFSNWSCNLQKKRTNVENARLSRWFE